MEFLRRSYLWLSVLLFPLLYGLDKIFLLPSVRDHFVQPGGMMYYRQRQEQLDLLREHLQRIRDSSQTVIVLGDSRSFGIGRHVAMFAGYQNPDIWNFAGPQAVPAYHDYLIEKIVAMPNAPKHFIIGLSPDGLSRNAGIFGSPVLVYGLDEDFVEKNRTMIPSRDLDIYIRSRRFALQGMQFSFGTLFSRIHGSLTQPDLNRQLSALGVSRNQLTEDQLMILQQMATVRHEDLRYYNYYKSPHRIILNFTGGAQLAWWGRMPDEQLRKETDQLVSMYLQRFVVSQEQMFFLERAMKRIRKAGGRAVVFWPAVNPYLRRVYEEEPAIAEIWRRVVQLADANQIKTINFNEPGRMTCQDYYDASHLAVTCFPAITTTLLKTLLEESPQRPAGPIPLP
jgi:hypothetical protein